MTPALLPVVVWAVLMAAQLGLLPSTSHAWAFNLTRYLPPWTALSLAAISLALCIAPLRRRAADAVAGLPARVRISARWWPLLIFVGLWLLRERHLYGDSEILILDAVQNRFNPLEAGANLLLRVPIRAAHALTDGSIEVMIEAARLSVCAFGTLALLTLWRVANRLAPGRAASATLLVVCGGLLRGLAGRVEVYPFLLAAALVYLWLALEHLEGRRGWLAPSLALGVAVWVHVGALCLVPSALVLPFLRGHGPRAGVRLVAGTLLVVALPTAVFFLGFALLGGGEELARMHEVVLQVLGRGSDPDAPVRWVRTGWDGAASRGTDYVFLSGSHLKYLANAAFLLTPACLPLLVALGLRRPRALVATPAACLLAAACAPLLIYALVLRPIWGPFDWDLFSLTALFLSLLAAHLLARTVSEAGWQDGVPWLVGLGACFVGIPFLLIGLGANVPAGPFAYEEFDWELMNSDSPSAERLRPWL